MLGISLNGVDNAGVTAGRQNITFAFGEPYVKQRVDRFAMLGRKYPQYRNKKELMDECSFLHIWKSKPSANGLLHGGSRRRKGLCCCRKRKLQSVQPRWRTYWVY